MKIGIYGGSFNPVHYGHIGLAKWVVEHTDLDAVWMLVSPSNPLKDPSSLPDEQVRLAGVQAAIQDIPSLVASDFEFHLPRPSYTANTLRELSRTYPQHDFSLVIGEDNWHIFNQWREHDYIMDHYRIFVYPRHSQSPTEGCPMTENGTAKKVVFLHEAPYFDISSTAIRANSSNTLQ